MREILLGAVVVGLTVGYTLGRETTLAKRSKKDYTAATGAIATAQANAAKAKKAMHESLRKRFVAFLAACALLLSVVYFAMRL